MFDIIGKKWLYFLISGVLIVPGIIGLLAWKLRPGIDFTGGTLLEIAVTPQEIASPSAMLRVNTSASASESAQTEAPTREKLQETVSAAAIEPGTIAQTGANTFLFRLKPITTQDNIRLQEALQKRFGVVREVRYETVGPTVGAETTRNAAKAVLIASVAIVVYIWWAFRKIPKPYSPLAFGICAVVALIHDSLFVIGVFSLLGHFSHVEVDSLFITAILTVMGFSVHDTIVVFDRIRENLRKMPGVPFADVVNVSINQTLVRSLSTSLTVLFTLVSLLLFGGESIRWFIVALLLGITAGTYSSIFNAAPLLVVWEQWRKRRKK